MPEDRYDNANPVISVKDLSVRFGNRSIWNGANFSVSKGEFVAIIGPNGAGKTTLVKMLLGLQRPSCGEIRVFDAPPTRGNRRIGYVPQRHSIDKDVRIEVLELVRLGASGLRWGPGGFTRDDKAEAMKALKAVGAEKFAHTPLGVLSGGELQRVFLAEALVSKPELLLLDEPLSNLDIKHESEMVRLISEVTRNNNVTVLLIAHNINPLLPYLDRTIYMANGKVRIGRPEEVMTSSSLTELYDMPVEVLKDSKGNIVVVGIENGHHCEGGSDHVL